MNWFKISMSGIVLSVVVATVAILLACTAILWASAGQEYLQGISDHQHKELHRENAEQYEQWAETLEWFTTNIYIINIAPPAYLLVISTFIWRDDIERVFSRGWFNGGG